MALRGGGSVVSSRGGARDMLVVPIAVLRTVPCGVVRSRADSSM